MRIPCVLTLYSILVFMGALTDIKKDDGEPGTLVARATSDEEVQFVPQTVGPSGTLKRPKGGSVYYNRLGNVSLVEVLFIGVSDGTNLFGARTCYIDIYLLPKEEKRTVQQHVCNVTRNNPIDKNAIEMTRGMRPHDSGSNQPIWASFVPPADVCGQYHFVVCVRQLFEDGVIEFQSAAPLITFKCDSRRALPTIIVENSAS